MPELLAFPTTYASYLNQHYLNMENIRYHYLTVKH